MFLDEPQLMLLVHAISRGGGQLRSVIVPVSSCASVCSPSPNHSHTVEHPVLISPLWAIFPAASDDRRFSTVVSVRLVLGMGGWDPVYAKGWSDYRSF